MADVGSLLLAVSHTSSCGGMGWSRIALGGAGPAGTSTTGCSFMETALAVIGAAGALLGCIGIIRDASHPTDRRRAAALVALVVIFAGMAAWFWNENRRMNDARADAAELVAKWDRAGIGLQSMGADDLEGIILGAVAFLESHKDQFPETFEQARERYRTQVTDFKPLIEPDEYFPRIERDSQIQAQLVRVAGGMHGLVESIAAD
jgi:hypothetical protein